SCRTRSRRRSGWGSPTRCTRCSWSRSRSSSSRSSPPCSSRRCRCGKPCTRPRPSASRVRLRRPVRSWPRARRRSSRPRSPPSAADADRCEGSVAARCGSPGRVRNRPRVTGMRCRRVAVVVRTITIAVVGVTACSSPEEEEADPAPVAEALAADLADGTFDGVALAEGTDPATAAEQLEALLGEVVEMPRTVAVAGITEVAEGEGDTEPEDLRDVALTWTYDMGADVEPMVVESTARLVRVADAEGEESWTAVWAPAVVHPDAAEGYSIATERTRPERGEVLGHGGEVLVEERPVMRIGIDKQNLDEDD